MSMFNVFSGVFNGSKVKRVKVEGLCVLDAFTCIMDGTSSQPLCNLLFHIISN